MKGTLFFVHGTGVRGKRLRDTLKVIRSGVANELRLADSVEVHACSWGKQFPIDVSAVSSTLPPDERGPAPEEPAPEESATEWAILQQDPLFALRVAAAGDLDREPPPPLVTVVVPYSGAAAVDTVRRMIDSVDLRRLNLEEVEVSEDKLKDAIALVRDSDELAGAARNATDDESIGMIACAIVAAVLWADHDAPQGAEPRLAVDVESRDNLTDELAIQLRTIVQDLPSTGYTQLLVIPGAGRMRRLAGFAAARARTRYGVGHRADLTTKWAPAIADVLRYQRRGSDMLQFVSDALAKAAPPVLAVGHSLGGVMLVDLLCRNDHPHVKLLVTVGSQSPMFFVMDALEQLRPGTRHDEPFWPWLNLYSRTDLLSFYAHDVFPFPHVVDKAIDIRAPFPQAHSAYWRTQQTYSVIADYWTRYGPSSERAERSTGA
jgi:hypothetical protein